METPITLHDDNSFMVIDKPSGWVVNEATTVKNTPTIQAWLKEKYDFPIFTIFEMRNGIVHRLDKETSGVLIIAKTPEAFTVLQDQFRARTVEKVYLALTHGVPFPAEGDVEVPVGRLPWNRRRFGILADGRLSLTHYEVKERYIRMDEEMALMELHPKTGRTHQIRIHMKYLNHPIVSDTFYAGRKTSRKDRVWCPRLFLHAARISLGHPENGEQVTVNSPLPHDLEAVLSQLEMLT